MWNRGEKTKRHLATLEPWDTSRDALFGDLARHESRNRLHTSHDLLPLPIRAMYIEGLQIVFLRFSMHDLVPPTEQRLLVGKREN